MFFNNPLLDKSFAFAVRIVNLYKWLTEEKHEYVLSKQVLRSGTSIGANSREGRSAQSKLDYINKLSIALKEADETLYWLELLKETNFLKEEEFQSIHTDCEELVKILIASIKTSKNNLNREK